jgi:hypothetical protein
LGQGQWLHWRWEPRQLSKLTPTVATAPAHTWVWRWRQRDAVSITQVALKQGCSVRFASGTCCCRRFVLLLLAVVVRQLLQQRPQLAPAGRCGSCSVRAAAAAAVWLLAKLLLGHL